MSRAKFVVTALLTLAVAGPEVAYAGGFEFQAPGTRALGRGGAFMARADDPMALGYNPAALAFLPGYQLQLGSHLTFYDACAQRSGGYDDSGVSTTFGVESRFGAPNPTDPNNFAGRDFPEVCFSGPPAPSPQLVFSGHPIPELGFAIGLLAPAGVGSGQWGNPDGSIDVDGVNLPSPTRYALVEQSLLLFHPSIGVGVSPVEWLSVGVTLQWGIAVANFVNHTTASGGPEDPADDVRTELSITDPFVPAMIASVHVVPIDELDIVLMARFSDSIDGDGTLTLTTGTFGTGMPGSLIPQTTVVNDVQLHAGQPWQFGFSVRYAERRVRRNRDPEEAGRVTGRVEDRMQNEVFDLELDVVYQLNSQVTDFVVSSPAGSVATVCEPPATPGGTPLCIDAPLPTSLPIPKGWNDQVAIRLGGDWNAIPGVLAIRAGTHFESSGLNSTYGANDFLPLMRLGLHVGLTVRIDRFDISAAYAHIFNFSQTVNPAEANYRLVAARGTENAMGCPTPPEPYDANRPVTDRGCYPQGSGSVVNAATYSGSFNVVSLSARYHFD